MKCLVVAVALAGLLYTTADAQSRVCKNQKGVLIDCRTKAPLKEWVTTPNSLTPADRDALNRAHTRSLLENIDSQLRRQR
jgi:hypothetical protein